MTSHTISHPWVHSSLWQSQYSDHFICTGHSHKDLLCDQLHYYCFGWGYWQLITGYNWQTHHQWGNLLRCQSVQAIHLKKNCLRNDPNVKISNRVSMCLFNELQGPLLVPWIRHTRWTISVKLKLILQMVSPTESQIYVTRQTDAPCHTIIGIAFVGCMKRE